MSIIIRTIKNVDPNFTNVILEVPGYDTTKPTITIDNGTTVDLFTVLTGDQLEAIQPLLNQFIASGEFLVIATVDTATFNPVGGGVGSLNGLTGSLTLVAGSNVTITPSGSNITIASSGGGGTPAGSNTEIQFNDNGVFGASSALYWNNSLDNLYITSGGGLSTALLFDTSGNTSVHLNARQLIDSSGHTQLDWSVDGTVSIFGQGNFNGNQIHNVADPTAPQDAATMNYVDTYTNNIKSVISAPTISMSGTQSVAVTGLLTTSQIIAVSQNVPGASGTLSLLGFSCTSNGFLNVTYVADPGAGGTVLVSFI